MTPSDPRTTAPVHATAMGKIFEKNSNFHVK